MKNSDPTAGIEEDSFHMWNATSGVRQYLREHPDGKPAGERPLGSALLPFVMS
jgi:hypothetical protein